MGIHSAAVGVDVKLEYFQVNWLLPKHLGKQTQPCLTNFRNWIRITQDEVLIWQYGIAADSDGMRSYPSDPV